MAGEEVNDIFIDETEAATVRRIFELSAVQGCGSRRISSILTSEGLYNRAGKPFPPSTIQNMLKNPMYTGVLRSGETSSAVFSNLQIISPELFELAQQQITSHRSDYEASRLSPEKPGRKALLSGNIFCGMCGARLYTTTSRTTHHRTVNVENRREALYRCASHLAHKRPCRCSGPTTYRASRVDAVVENAVKDILRRIQITGVSEYLAKQRAAETGALKAQLKHLERSHAAAAAERQKLTQYILSALEGNGPFTAEDLKGRMDTLQEECSTLSEQMAKQRELLENSENRERLITQQFELLKNYAEVYEGASIEEKRKIISALVERVEVSRGYHIQIQFRIGADLLNGIEAVA